MSQKKTRPQIPRKIEAEVLFLNDHACCICHDPSKPVVIHHLNENRSHNRVQNLGVVCLECHDRIHTKGPTSKGFSRTEIKQYKSLWQQSIARRREYLALPRVKERVTETDPRTGVVRHIEREVPYLDGLALKAFEISPPLRLPEDKERTLEEARRITATRGDADRLLVIAARIKGGEITDATDEMILSRVCLAIGDARFHEADYPRAETFYQEALDYAESAGEPGVLEISLSEMAAAVGMQGRHEEALGYLERLVTLNHDDWAAWYNTGICLLALGRVKEAMSASRRAIELGREAQAWNVVASGYLNLGVVYDRAGQHEQAIEWYEEGIEIGTEAEEWTAVARAHYNMGTAHAALGNHHDAIESCLNAIEIGTKAEKWSTVATACGQMGASQLRLGLHADAIESYQMAVEVATNGEEWDTVAAAYVGLGRAYGELRQYRRAIESFVEAIESGGTVEAWDVVARARLGMGLAYGELGQYDQAIASYGKATEAGRKVGCAEVVATAYDRTGLAQIVLERYQEAIESYEKAIEMAKQCHHWGGAAVAYVGMALAHGGVDTYVEAINSCHMAIEMGRKAEDLSAVAVAHHLIGKFQAELGNHEDALGACLRALGLRPCLPDGGAEVFTDIAAFGCVLGTEALLDQNLPRAREHAEMIADAHSDAQKFGMGQLLLDALDTFESSLPKGHQKAFKRFKQLVMECLQAASQ